MVIGFDGSRAFIGERTGTENYSYQLLKALAEIDEKNHYIVYTHPITLNSTIVTKSVMFPGNFWFKEIGWRRLWTQGGLALQTFKDQLDVLFVPAHTLPIIRKPGLKTVVTVHDLGSEYLPQMHQLKQRVYLSYMQRYQLKAATKIIAVSQATKDDLVERVGIKPCKVEVVYEGLDQKLFKPVQDDLLINSLLHYNLQPKTYYLFVGTVQPRKNLARLIKAFAKFSSKENAKNTHLVIAGSKGWLSDEIYQLPKKLGIAEQVKFLGYVPEKDLPALYSGAIVLVFPSLFEGFGLPILEAQACGCPVITSNTSSMPEVAGKGAILVNPYSVDEIKDAMIRVKGEACLLASRRSGPAGRAERGKLIKRGFENVKRFSWERCATQTLKVFEDLRDKIYEEKYSGYKNR